MVYPQWTKEFSFIEKFRDSEISSGFELPYQRGFLINYSAAQEYYRRERELPEELFQECIIQIHNLEKAIGRSFGGADDSFPPLLLAVHSMAPSECIKMRPFNIGLTRTAMLSMARFTRNYRESLKSYIQFLRDFGVLIIEKDCVEYDIVEQYYKDSVPVADVLQAPVDVLEAVASDFHALTYNNILEDPYEQLYYAIRSVLNKSIGGNQRSQDSSWYLESDLLVQVMVHSDRNLHSGTGVVYTRSPLTGARRLAGEYISQSLDGRSASRGAKIISVDELYRKNMMLEEQLVQVCRLVEESNHDMQAIEFAVEDRRLFLLKIWSGARSPGAALNIANELAQTMAISPEEALLRVRPYQIDAVYSQSAAMLCLHNDMIEPVSLLGKGRPSSSGITTGIVFFHCCDRLPPCEKYILVCDHTAMPNEDLLDHASGFICNFSAMNCPLTRKARLQNKPHIVDICSCEIDVQGRSITTPDGIILRESDIVSMNAFTGEIFVGKRCPLSLNKPRLFDEIKIEEFLFLAKSRVGTEIYLYSDGAEPSCFAPPGAYIDCFSVIRDQFGIMHDEVKGFLINLAWLSSCINKLPQNLFFRLFGTSEYELNLLIKEPTRTELIKIDPAPSHEAEQKIEIETVIKKQLIAFMEVSPSHISCPAPQCIVVGPILSPGHLKQLLSVVNIVVGDIKSQSMHHRFSLGILIDSPIGCFNIGKLLDVYEASGEDCYETFTVIFKFDPLIDLLMGHRLFNRERANSVYRDRTISSIRAFDDWGVGGILEHCIVQIKNFSDKVSTRCLVGVLASRLHDHEVVVKFCNHARVDWLACDASSAPSALLASAQANLTSPMFKKEEVISEM